MSEPLKPCPFCQCNLEHKTLMPGGNILRHPWKDGSCVLSGIEFPTESAPDWNRRTPPASGGRDRPSTAGSPDAAGEVRPCPLCEKALVEWKHQARQGVEWIPMWRHPDNAAGLCALYPVRIFAKDLPSWNHRATPADTRHGFPCKAHGQSLPEPADCNWPLCGCDPYADKVINAIEEAGFPIAEQTQAPMQSSKGTPPLSPESNPWREMALEEAAKIADAEGHSPHASASYCAAAFHIAMCIRALKSSPPAPEQSEECLSDRHHKSDE